MKYIIVLLITFIFAACSNNKKEEVANSIDVATNVLQLTSVQIKNAQIKIGSVDHRLISKTIRANGKIDVPPQNLVSVSVAVGGYLKSTQLLPGMHLKKGEIIATLEDQAYIQLQQEFLTSKIELQTCEIDYERQKELNKTKAASDKVLEKSYADYQSKKILNNSLAEKLRLLNINPINLNENTISRTINLYAPFDGYVSKINVNVGKYISSSEVLFELVNPNDIHLNLLMFEKDLMNLSIGQKLIAFSNSKPDTKYNCEIILISQDIRPDGTSEVHCHFENYSKTLLPGMYMNAEIELKDKIVLALPESAILNYEGKNFVFIQTSSNTFKFVEIKIGDKENGWVEIFNNELEKQKVVTENAYTLLMSLKNTTED